MCVASQSLETVDKAPGVIETCAAAAAFDSILTGQDVGRPYAWTCPIAAKPSASSARHPRQDRCHQGTQEVTSSLTSGLSPRAGARPDSQRLMTLVRGHWEIDV